jgi:hypothetical protein
MSILRVNITSEKRGTVEDKSYFRAHKMKSPNIDYSKFYTSILDGSFKSSKLTSESVKLYSKPSDNSLLIAVHLHLDTRIH